jgi:hypothetical protein
MTPPPTSTACLHDYEHPIRKGRATYHCPKCDADISLIVILIAAADWEAEEINKPKTER